MNHYSIESTQVKKSTYMNHVFSWMSVALLITGFMAWWAATTPTFLQLLFPVSGGINKIVFYGLIALEFGLVWWLTSKISQLSSETATLLFVVYAVLNGVTLSSIFLVYTASSIASTFFITSATFGAMSLYGYTTKKDLTQFGSLLMMAVIGLIITSIVNIFFIKSGILYWIMNGVGVLVFVGLTAYDTQKIKNYLNQVSSDEEAKKTTIIGALTLYLDFINLFIYLLRFLGDRR